MSVDHVTEAAHWIALLPLAWLVTGVAHGRRFDGAWWLIAAAFGVSFAADGAAHYFDPWFVSIAFPVTQAGMIAAVMLTRAEAALFVCLMCTAGLASVITRGVEGPDVLLSTVANLGVAGIVIDRKPLGRIRDALLVYFGGGGVAWLLYAALPYFPLPASIDRFEGWVTWGIYKLALFVGLVLFCVATAPEHVKMRRVP